MTPDVTNPRQLAPTVGPAVKSVTFRAGSKSGCKDIAIGQVEDINGVPFIDDSEWGPEADHIEFGYIVPIGSVKIWFPNFGAVTLASLCVYKEDSQDLERVKLSSPKP